MRAAPPKPRANSGDAHGWQGVWLADRTLRNYAAGLSRLSGNFLNLGMTAMTALQRRAMQISVGRGRERPSEICNAMPGPARADMGNLKAESQKACVLSTYCKTGRQACRV